MMRTRVTYENVFPVMTSGNATAGEESSLRPRRTATTAAAGDGSDGARPQGAPRGDDPPPDADDVPEPAQLPPSTHSLLFTQPVGSVPFFFALVVLGLSFACLGLAFYNNYDDTAVPVNVTPTVRWAQYLGILISLLMEEEIPTGLYLLRKIPRPALQQKFPQMKYGKFAFSSLMRILNGYFFLASVVLVLSRSSGVIEIFYDVLALQFVQQLDDIAFALAKMDVLGRPMRRACTAKCFQTEFAKQRSGRNKHLSLFLGTLYFLNLCVMFGFMLYVSIRQLSGSYLSSDVTVDFGTTVWEDSWVTIPTWLPPHLNASSRVGEKETWTLVFSYFNGVYTRNGKFHDGRPVYAEKRKSDREEFQAIAPAQIKYCREIKAWVFTHDNISKRKSGEQSGCNWLLRSPRTTEYNLVEVDGNWKIWVGTIVKAEVNIQDNQCQDSTDCNLNGECNDGVCSCGIIDGVQYLGNHCEIGLKDSCRTIEGEQHGEVLVDTSVAGITSPNDVFAPYSRPLYLSRNDEFFNDDYLLLLMVYSGNRWFYTGLTGKMYEHALELDPDFWEEYHAFWYQAYSSGTLMVSDPTSGSIPVGVDFYTIGEKGNQFGPFGALIPSQRYNQTGRGYFRCVGPDVGQGDGSITNQKLQLGEALGRK